MRYLLLFLPFTLIANIWVIQTEDYLGRVIISKSDYIIVSREHSLANHYGITNRIVCETNECISDNIRRLKHKWRTRGISVITIKDSE